MPLFSIQLLCLCWVFAQITEKQKETAKGYREIEEERHLIYENRGDIIVSVEDVVFYNNHYEKEHFKSQVSLCVYLFIYDNI
jgi:hypothetical protein